MLEQCIILMAHTILDSCIADSFDKSELSSPSGTQPFLRLTIFFTVEHIIILSCF